MKLRPITHEIYKVLKYTVVATMTMGISTHLFAGEGEDLLNAKNDANDRGYGRKVTMDFSSIVIVNKSGEKLKLRDSKTDKDNAINNNATADYTIPKNEDFQISLNGDGESDDIVIRDDRGFVEYKADSRSILGIKHKNVWINLLTWTGNFWQLITVSDSVDGTKTFLVPWVDGNKINVLVKKSKDGFGRQISKDFKTLRLENKSKVELPLRVKNNGEDMRDSGKLKPGESREFKIHEVAEISLNGDGGQDDLKINNDKGYIELLAARVEGLESGNVWINHFWWNDRANNWYGTLSKTGIDGNKNMILSALEGKNVNKQTGVVSKDDVLVFTIIKK